MKPLTPAFVPVRVPPAPARCRDCGRGRAWGFLGVAALVLFVVVPICNLAVPAGSVFHLSDYMVTLVGKIMCYAIVALAMDLIWGYTGILSLGHGLFFALGGYAMGMYLMRSIGHDGVYKSDLPDFMVFLDWKAYPWYWSFTDHFWYCALLVVLVPGVLAFVFGFFAFRSRIKGVYFSIITQALTYAFMLLFFRNDTGFGGNNGFTDFKRILGFPITAPETRIALFMLTGAALIAFLFLGRAIVSSKLGRVLTAIRDAETRVMFSGYNPVYFKLFIWTLSAVICGIAGALYVPQVGIINPSEMSPANSIEIAIWTAVGGRGTLIGPVIGARRGQPRQELVHAGAARVLAVRARPAVHPRHAVPAARHRGTVDEEAVMMNLAVFAEHSGEAAISSKATGISDGHVVTPGVDISHGGILYLDSVSVSFDGFKALNDLTLTVDAGELRCVIGPNGAGKTTMMDVITGKTRPDAGTAFFGQTIDLTRLSEPEIADIGIGRKFQKPTVFTDHTVFENLELAKKADKRVWPTLRAKLDSTARDRILDDPRDDSARAGGRAPRRPPVARPEAVARDRHAAHAGAAAPAARRAGRRHDRRRDDAQRRAVRVARRRLHAGRRRARHGFRRADRRPRDGAARGPRARRGLDAPGAAERASHRSVPGPIESRMLSVAHLNQYYGGSHILRDVSFDVPAGKCTTLLGRNGVGKTTLLRCLMGLMAARSGEIRFDERGHRGAAAVRARAPGPGLRAAGPRHLPAPHGAREPARWASRRRSAAPAFRSSSSRCSRC